MSTEIESLELKIVSDSKNATKGIDALTQSLKRLSGATSSLTGVSKKIGQIATATDKASMSGQKASTSFTDLYYKLKTAARGFQMVGRTIYSAIQKSSDYVENVNLFTVAMGDYAGEAKEYAETVGEAMGIDPGEWMRNQGVFMTLATGFGVAGDRAAVMSKNLTQLGYDLSSFFNISYEDAMQKLQSGLSGELEPLRRIGYDLSQAKLEATALELGIDKTVSSMTQAEKAQLRYYAIMTQVTTAQGDMARTLDAPANQLKVFKAQVNMAAREIGNVFIPALNAVLPYAIAVAKVIRALASTLASIVGFEMPEVDYSGVNAMGNTATDTSEALADATESAKKLKSYMLGFDELNVINPTADSGLGGIDDVVNDFNFELPEYDFLEGLAETKIAAIVEKMKEWLGITDDIDSWSDLFHSKLGLILGVAGLIGGALLTWKIAEGVIDGVNAISNLGKAGTMTLGLTLAVTGITIGALAIENALTEGLNGVNATALFTASASVIAGGALIGKAFGDTMIGAAIGAIVAGLAGLGIGIYDAIENELNVTNGLTIALGATLVGIGVASLLPTIKIAGLTIGGAFGKAFLGAAMGLVIGGAIVGAIWLFQNTDSWLEKIGGLVSGALLAVGAILAFTGVNLPLGIGLMVAGAVSMGSSIAMNTTALSDEVKEVIAIITGVVAGALLAVGAILAFTGVNIPLGIALMAGGALTLGTAIAPNWTTLSDSVQETITAIMTAVGAATLALGAILAFTGVNIPLGIGLMVVGAASIASAVALNWDSLTGDMESTISTLTTIVGGALLGLGAVLAFTGANIPLGIGLMAVGAITLGSSIAMNTDALSDEVKGVIAVITAAVSLALLAVGAILAFTGANIPLGIALMAGGALTMGSVVVPNWNELSDSVQDTIALIMAGVGAALLVVGAIFAFSGTNIPLGIGLMLVGATSLGAAITLNWNAIAEALQGPVGTVTAVISGAFLALGALLAFSGANIPLGIGLMLVGAAGLATVVAANWDSITNALQGPVGAITAIVSGALLVLGAILAFTGVGIPLGIALMLAGAAGLATVITLNWNSIKDTIDTVIKKILKIVSGAMLVLGVLMCLSGAGIGLGLALIFGALKLSNTAWGTDDNPITNFVKKMVNGIVKIINKAIDGINEMFHIEFDGLKIAGVEIIPSFNIRMIDIPNIPLMAEGGFPEQGQMFIAREAGAEMVGNIGRRTAVANNDQIVSGIAGGVSEANEEQNALLREQNSLLRAILEKDSGVYLDGKSLTNSVEKHQRERGRVLITGGVI